MSDDFDINIHIKNEAERYHISKEQPILLRLPEDEASVLRQQIREGNVSLKINIPQGDIKGTCLFNGKEYCATIVRLPCVVETHKSYDDVAMYKTGDIGQAIIIHDKDNPPKCDEIGRLRSGLTPPTNRIVSKFKKPTIRPEEIEKNKRLSEEIAQHTSQTKTEDEDN